MINILFDQPTDAAVRFLYKLITLHFRICYQGRQKERTNNFSIEPVPLSFRSDALLLNKRELVV